MKPWLLASTFLCWPTFVLPVQAQVRQGGNVTPTHFACWTSAGVVQDCGASTSPYPTTGGVLGPFCVLSAAPTSAGYVSFCLSATTGGGGVLTAQSHGTAPVPGITFDINGAAASIPLVTGATVSGDGACFNNTTGGLIDCGFAPVSPFGTDSNILNSRTSNYTIASTDCGKTIQAGTGTTGLFTLTLPSVSGFPTTCSVLVKNNDTGRGKILSGFPTDLATILWPQQSVGVKIVNGAWASFYNPGRYRLTGSISVFANPSVGSDSNDCLATGAGNACLTLQGAADVAVKNFDYNGRNVITIQGANATYNNLLSINQMPPGFWGPDGLIIDLAGGTLNVANNALTIGSGSNGLDFSGCGQATLQNMTIIASAGADLSVYGGCGQALIKSTVNFGASVGPQIVVAHNAFVLAQGYTISGSAGAGAQPHLQYYGGGYIASENVGLGAPVITCTGSPAFSSFVLGTENGVANYSGSSFSGCGSVTGTRYNLSGGARLFASLGASGANFFPGNAAGLVTLDASYDSAGTPAVSACGTTPGSPMGTDISGSVVEGSTATGCTLTFTTLNAPKACTVSTSSPAIQTGLVISTLNSTTLTVTHPSVSGATLYWSCPANT